MPRFVPFLLLALTVSGAETVILHTGFRIRAEKIERLDGRYRLHVGTGVVEVQAADVAEIEVDQVMPAPARRPGMPDTPAREIVVTNPEPPAPPKPAEAPAPAPPTPGEIVTAMAEKHGLPPEIVHAVASTESAYQTKAVSPKGAIGVMQLMPSTARALGADPNNVESNIEAGTRHLRELLLRYQGTPNPVRRALAAYNAGVGAVARYDGVPPYRETQDYVEKVIDRYWKLKRSTGVPSARPAQPRGQTPSAPPAAGSAPPASDRD